MLLPTLQTDNSSSAGLYKMTTRDLIQTFTGYNHNLRTPDGSFFDMGNLTSDLYPVMTQRKQRGTIGSVTSPNGIVTNEKLAYVDGTTLYYDGEATGLTTLSDGEKQMVPIGSKICIFPDGKYYDTADGSYGSLGLSVTGLSSVKFVLCQNISTEFNVDPPTTKPVNPSNGDYWLDTGSTPNVLKQWSSSSGVWTSVPTTYVKIKKAGIGSGISTGDAVTMAGCDDAQFNPSLIIRACGSDYLVVTGIIAASFTNSGAISLTREIPTMQFFVQLNNRIWGCSADGHHLYACALGDPKNWKKFDGIASDSYEVTIGSDGPFTGAAAYRNTIYFFKEGRFHKIYGTQPSNFEVTDSIINGVKKGADRSIVQIESYLYYLSPSGVVVFDGTFATSIADAFGQEQFSAGVAGTVDFKYYISMKDASDAWHLFVYDTRRGMWHREDDLHVLGFSHLDGELYALTSDSLIAMKGSSGTAEGALDWYAESGDIGLDLPDYKYVSRIVLRVRIGASSMLRVLVGYDDGPMKEVGHFFETDLHLKQIPIVPERCDHMRIRMEGHGEFRLYSMAKVIEQGSEL